MENEKKSRFADKTRVTIELDKDSHKKLRIIAAYDEITMAEWIKTRVLSLIDKELPK